MKTRQTTGGRNQYTGIGMVAPSRRVDTSHVAEALTEDERVEQVAFVMSGEPINVADLKDLACPRWKLALAFNAIVNDDNNNVWALKIIAKHPCCPEFVLRDLAVSAEYQVAVNASENPNLPMDAARLGEWTAIGPNGAVLATSNDAAPVTATAAAHIGGVLRHRSRPFTDVPFVVFTTEQEAENTRLQDGQDKRFVTIPPGVYIVKDVDAGYAVWVDGPDGGGWVLTSAWGAPCTECDSEGRFQIATYRDDPEFETCGDCGGIGRINTRDELLTVTPPDGMCWPPEPADLDR